jgi:tripartite-type tricarboxylate transporter receptor subunit TctC
VAQKPAAAASPVPTAVSAAKPAGAFDAKAVEDFYRGKTIRIIVGFGAGGPFDLFSRLVSRYLPQYIPGTPSVIVENKPGAGSILAANLVYKTEPNDGTVIGNIGTALPLLQALGREGIEFDATKFQWLGNGSKTFTACAVLSDTGIKSITEIMGPYGKELIIGAIGPGTSGYDVPAVLNAALDLKFKIVSGYGGTPDILGALERKEVNGNCAFFDSFTSTRPEFFQGDNPGLKILVATGTEPSAHPWLRAVPLAESLAKTDEAKQMIKAIDAPAQANFAYTVGPGVPLDRVEALRKALADTFVDGQFIADAKRANFEVNTNSGQQLRQLYEGVFNTPPAVLAKLKEILK